MAEEINIKEALHQTIEDINDDTVLYAAYALLQKNKNQQTAPSEEQLNILLERDAQYQAGKMKVYSFEELDAEMKKKYGFQN